jgi:hypothetical protein
MLVLVILHSCFVFNNNVGIAHVQDLALQFLQIFIHATLSSIFRFWSDAPDGMPAMTAASAMGDPVGWVGGATKKMIGLIGILAVYGYPPHTTVASGNCVMADI